MTATPDAPARRVAYCPTSRTERIMRGAIALVVATFAVSMAAQPWIAVPVGLLAVFLAFSAISGWCPSDWLPRRRAVPVRPNALGYPEARGHVTID